MELKILGTDINDYLENTYYVDYESEAIKAVQNELFSQYDDEISKIQKAYHFVRDNISHSWDIQSRRITVKASEVLKCREGICYAKSNLLAALLRSQKIPTGFCYQRLTLGDTPDTGYCIHALNAVYVESINKWIRLDARGNKEGICAKFSLEEEILAFPIREEYQEVDYDSIYPEPHFETMKILQESYDCLEMYTKFLPDSI